MAKNFTAVFAVCLAISSLPLACGDDEDDNGGGKGGSSGKGGSAGEGGTSGTSGSAGKGGTSGTSGAGGKGGTSGTSGTGGTSGTAGTDGGMGGADGGVGGEGGGGGPQSVTCEELCARVTAITNCADDSMCEVEVCATSAGPPCDDEVQAFHDCAGNAPDDNFSCGKGDRPIYDYFMGGECDEELDAALQCIPI